MNGHWMAHYSVFAAVVSRYQFCMSFLSHPSASHAVTGPPSFLFFFLCICCCVSWNRGCDGVYFSPGPQCIRVCVCVCLWAQTLKSPQFFLNQLKPLLVVLILSGSTALEYFGSSQTLCVYICANIYGIWSGCFHCPLGKHPKNTL